MALNGDYLYLGIGGYTSFLRVMDVSNPTAPIVVGDPVSPTTGGPSGMAVGVGLIYVANHTDLWIGDISDPSVIVEAARYDAPERTYSVAYDRGFAFLADELGGLWVLALDNSAPMELMGLEVTQSVQNWLNDVDLIEGKPTYVRAHVRSYSGTIENVEAKLIARRGNETLVMSPSNNGRNIDVSNDPERTQPEQSFYFALPDDWWHGTIDFEFVGTSHYIACHDHADAWNDCRVTRPFLSTAALKLNLVPIIWGDNNEHAPSYGDCKDTAGYIKAIYPVSRLDWSCETAIDWNLSSPPNLYLLLSRLAEERQLDCLLKPPGQCERIYFGLLVDQTPTSIGGLALTGGWVGAGYIIPGLFHEFPAHEVGHTLGRGHAPCDLPWYMYATRDYNFPYDGGLISQETQGDEAYFGYDPLKKSDEKLKVVPPSSPDFMGYCYPSWISDYTYEGLRLAINARFGSSSFLMGLSPLEVAQPVVVVSGVITPTSGMGELTTLITLTSTTPISPPSPGEYTIRLIDAADQELAAYSFEPEVTIEGEEPLAAFSLLLPWDIGSARVSLSYAGQEIDSRQASGDAPAISVISPNGGELLDGATATITWSAGDPDGDALQYYLQYSADGGITWQTLVTSLTSESYELSLENIAGSDQALIRVLASDGFYTTQDQSDGVFTVARHAPRVHIETPADESLYVGDQLIILNGAALDNEDGELVDAALIWNSSVDGLLGNGASLAVSAAMLTEGVHTVTLTAQDSDGQIDTAEVTLTVYRERPVLPAIMSVAPATLGLSTVVGGEPSPEQSLSIYNSGDITLTWNVITDQNWIVLDVLTGTAPSEVMVSADPIGLATGQYQGTITFTSTEAINSPQVVNVFLSVYAPSAAAFDAQPLSGVAPLTVQFTNASTGDFSSCSWNLGDGATSVSCSPFTHTYSLPDTYTISLTISGPGGTDTETLVDYIQVFEPVAASFLANLTTGIAPLIVNFVNQSTGDFDVCLWDFGDGATSNNCDSLNHTYAVSGTYTVSLMISGWGGSDTELRTDYIQVYAPAVAGFVATPTSGIAPLTVNFTNQSTGDFDTCQWDFGDGAASISCGNVSHTYIVAGVYTVSLAVNGLGGSDTESRTDYVEVYAPVSAGFMGAPASGAAPLSVSFTNQSTGDFDTCQWDFGDGVVSASCGSVSHTYIEAGVYTVSLAVNGPGGSDTDSHADYIAVYAPVSAGFVGAPTSGVAPLSVNFTNQSSGDFDVCQWDFGDGAVSTSCTSVNHTYNTSGVYVVTLAVSGLGGSDTESRADYIQVFAPVAAAFIATPTFGTAPLAVGFTNQSTGDFNVCQWVFGDGATSDSCDNIVHAYIRPGRYTVRLFVSGPGGSRTLERTDYIVVGARVYLPAILKRASVNPQWDR